MNISLILLSILSIFSFGCSDSDDDGGKPSAAPAVEVSSDALTFIGEGGSQTITITANHEWGATISTDDSWVKMSPSANTSAAGGSTTSTITVEANPNKVSRSASIIIAAGTARKTITVNQDAATETAYNAPDGYKLVWHDEFESGTELGEDWTHEVQNPGWVNSELQYYVNHVSPSGTAVTEISDGKLLIHCFKENGNIYSGRVYAKRSTGWTYGYIEASIKLPKGKGTWPAFWMMPVNFTSWPANGEIDIMEEVGYHPNYVSSSLHATNHVHTNNTQVTHEMYCEGAEGQFHKYAIEWTPDNITTYVDGQVQLSYDNTGKGKADWPYNAPFYVILNLAWGGSWGAAGGGVDETALPATMEVEYVRVFQK